MAVYACALSVITIGEYFFIGQKLSTLATGFSYSFGVPFGYGLFCCIIMLPLASMHRKKIHFH